MPINNITQTISTIPPAGARGIDVQTQFVIKQEDFQDHLQGTTVTELNTLKDQLNSRIGEINSTATTMNGYADTASAGASTASTKAGEASISASGALTSRNQASTFATNSSNSATKASQWADNNYNVEVETGKYSAKHWATEANNVIASTNLLRADKYLAAQNVVKMTYNINKKLIKVQYNNPTDIDYEVLSYTDGKLTNVAHYVGSVLKGNTVLTYVGGLLNNAPFIAVV